MCGRFAFYSPSEATAALFGVDASIPVEARYNIAPSQYIAGIREAEDRHRELAMLKWGLVPFWAKDPAIGNRMINARAETVAEKPSFRAAYDTAAAWCWRTGFMNGTGAATPRCPITSRWQAVNRSRLPACGNHGRRKIPGRVLKAPL